MAFDLASTASQSDAPDASACSTDSRYSPAGDVRLASSDVESTGRPQALREERSFQPGISLASSDGTPLAGEIRLVSADVTPRSGDSRLTDVQARCGRIRPDGLDGFAASPESLATDLNDFNIVSGDGAPGVHSQMETNDEDMGIGIASDDEVLSQSPVELQEMPLRFRSRIDGEDHFGQLIRNVELLGRRYLILRTEPSEEDMRHGMKSIIHVFGMGFLNPGNDDIVMLDSNVSEAPSGGCCSSSSNSSNGSTAIKAAGCRAEEHQERRVEEPGLFVPDSQRFQQKELLGSGGFADVYKYVKLDPAGRPLETYAVKEVDLQQLSWRVGADQERLVRWVARLEFEVRNLLKLRGHPGVVKVHDAFAYRARFYIVMEYVNGTDLGRRLKSRGRLEEQEARGLFAQMAEALRHSHALDVIHRDFKPHNILLASPLRPGQPDVVKLVDFGLSKDISGSAAGTSTPFLGTKYYRAPETRHAMPGQENYDAAKVDVFALGVTLFAMLSGAHPQEGQEVTELSLRGSAWERVSTEARDLLLGLLKHEPDRRLSLDDVIEHPWLCVNWGRRPMDADGRSLGQGEKQAEDEEVPKSEEDQPAAGPSFLSAFPDAPATSSAARIPAAGGSLHGTPEQSNVAPGWDNILAWMHSDAATAAAQEILSHAGKASAPVAAFGRTPLVGRGRIGSREAGGPSPGKAANGISPAASPVKTTQASPAETPLSSQEPGELRLDDDVKAKAEEEAPAAQPSLCRIKWVSCAPRFASVWRFSQAAGRLSPAGASPMPSPIPSPPLTQGASRDECLTGTTSIDGTATEPRAAPAQGRRPSVIGFVQAPRLLAVDGAMVTITHAQRSVKLGRAWGFVSETCRSFGFASREEAMRAAETALLGQAATG